MVNVQHGVFTNIVATDNYQGVLLDGLFHNRIEDSSFIGTQTQNSAVIDVSNSQHNEFINCNIDSSLNRGIFLHSDSHNNQFIGNTINSAFYIGIYDMMGSNNSYISNIIEDCESGIYLNDAFNVTVKFNTIQNNKQTGIILDGESTINYESNNTISGNIIADNFKAGVHLEQSKYNIIEDNALYNNGFLFRMIESTNIKLPQQSFTNNSLNGKDILFLYDQPDQKILADTHAGQIILMGSDNIEITAQVLDHGTTGIYSLFSNGLYIHDNNITQNSVSGIYMSSSSGMVLTKNNISENGYSIIDIDDPITPPGAGEGYYSYGLSDSNITNNEFSFNKGTGVQISGFSSGVNVSDNIVSNNMGHGINLEGSTSNSNFNHYVARNEITSNGKSGIRIFYSNDNTVLDNVLVDNTFVVDGFDIASLSVLQQLDISGNTVNGLPVVWYQGTSNVQIITPFSVSVVILINVDGAVISNQNLYGASILFSKHVSLSGVAFLESYFGMRIIRTSNSTFEDFSMTSIQSHGISMAYSEDNWFNNSDISLGKYYGFYGYVNRNTTVMFLSIHDMTQRAIQDAYSENSTYIYLDIHNVGNYGVNIFQGINATIMNSTFDTIPRHFSSLSTAIMLNTYDTALIKGNIIKNSMYGIYVDAVTNAKIENNEIYYIEADGIHIFDHSSLLNVESNLVYLSNNGIYMLYSEAVNITGNTVIHAQNALYMSYTTGPGVNVTQNNFLSLKDGGHDGWSSTLSYAYVIDHNYWYDWAQVTADTNPADGILDAPYVLGINVQDDNPLASPTHVLHYITTPRLYGINSNDILVNGTTPLHWVSSTDTSSHSISYTLSYNYDGGPWIEIASGLTVTAYTWDTSLLPDGTSYRLRVTAIGSEGLMTYYTTGFFIIANVPHTISELSIVTPNSNEILSGFVTLTWTVKDSWFHDLYMKIEYSLDGMTFTTFVTDMAIPNNSYYLDTTKLPDGNITLLLTVRDDYGLAVQTRFQVTTDNFAISTAPLSLYASESSGTVKLTWSAPYDNGGAPISSYNIYRSTDGNNWNFIGNTSDVQFTDSDVTAETTYYYYVTAVNSEGESVASQTTNVYVPATPPSSNSDGSTNTPPVSTPPPGDTGNGGNNAGFLSFQLPLVLVMLVPIFYKKKMKST